MVANHPRDGCLKIQKNEHGSRKQKLNEHSVDMPMFASMVMMSNVI